MGVPDEEDVARSFGFAAVLLRAGVLGGSLLLLPVGQSRWVSPGQSSNEAILRLEVALSHTVNVRGGKPG